MKSTAPASSAHPPGTVLRDIHALLEMLQDGGIEAGSGNVPAMQALPHINERLAEPLRIDLRRGQLRSYPNIQGLYMLLRTTGLLRTEPAGATTKLVVDAPNAEAFCSLNPTEQFGSLLDAWLIKAHLASLGIDRNSPHDFPSAAFTCWQRVSRGGSRFSVKDRRGAGIFSTEMNRLSLSLLHAFGLIELEQGRPITGKPWHPSAVRRTSFGTETLTALAQSRTLPYYQRSLLRLSRRGQPGPTLSEDLDSLETAPAGLRDGITFDTLQPALQAQLPAWHRSLALPPLPFREGTFTFKVSLPKVWRRIAISAGSTFAALSTAIIDSVDFDFDHLWEFSFLDRIGREVSIVSPFMNDSAESHRADAVLIGDFPLAEGQSMSYRYDFGDNWQFDVTLEGVDAKARKLKTPKVIASRGKAPEQYEDWC